MSQRYRPSKQEINAEIRRTSRQLWLKRTAVFAMIGAAILLLIHLATPMQVHGPSMQPTLADGEWTFINRFATSPKRGDVVVVSIGGTWIVKRVIGLAGDRIDLNADGTVTRNGEPVEIPNVTPSRDPCDMTFPLEVPEGRLFLMGDNRAHSVDSRSAEVGLVNQHQLIGTLWLHLSGSRAQ